LLLFGYHKTTACINFGKVATTRSNYTALILFINAWFIFIKTQYAPVRLRSYEWHLSKTKKAPADPKADRGNNC